MIVKRSLADEVAAVIQERITTGHYEVGTQLPIEPELMKSFGVGRSTVREAIKILSNSGLLLVKQGLGTFVEESYGIREPMDQKLRRAKIQDLDEVRQLLEMKISEKAALNRTVHDIAQITKHLQDRKDAYARGSLEDCVEADIRFHIAIAEASKNEILIDLYKSISIHLRERFLHIHPNLNSFEETNGMHEQILKSIIAGDPKKAWSNSAKLLNHISK